MISREVVTGGGGERHNRSVVEVTYYRERLRRYRLGLGAGICSVTMLFLALTGAFFARQRGVGIYDTTSTTVVWPHFVLPNILWINTFILAISSITVELARRNLARRALLAPIADIPGLRPEPQRSLPWLGITIILGLGFFLGQALAWRDLRLQGLTISSNPSSQFFYLFTGIHAAHLLGGLLVLLYAGLTHFIAKLETRCIVVDVSAWYWHFMGVLWLYIFFLLHLAK